MLVKAFFNFPLEVSIKNAASSGLILGLYVTSSFEIQRTEVFVYITYMYAYKWGVKLSASTPVTPTLTSCEVMLSSLKFMYTLFYLFWIFK